MRMYAAQTVAKGTGTTSLIVSIVAMHLSTRAEPQEQVFRTWLVKYQMLLWDAYKK